MSFGKAAASGAPSTLPKAGGRVGREAQQSSKAKSPKTQAAVRLIDIRDIHVGKRLRSLKQEKVVELANSMARQGQLQPIVVRHADHHTDTVSAKYILLAGLHRLKAGLECLGWIQIQAAIHEYMEPDAGALAEIDENLIRADLEPAELANHIGRRKELYEKAHPETKQGKAPGKAGGGKKAKGVKSTSFAKATAKATGRSKSAIEKAAKRANKLSKLLDRINGTSLDKGVEMDALCKLSEAEQEDLVARAAAGQQVSAKEVLAAKKKSKSEPVAPEPVDDECETDSAMVTTPAEPKPEDEATVVDECEPPRAAKAGKPLVVADLWATMVAAAAAAPREIVVFDPRIVVEQLGAARAETFARAILAELDVYLPQTEVSEAPDEFFRLVLKPGDALRWDDYALAKDDSGKGRGTAEPIPGELDYLISPEWDKNGEVIGQQVERRTYNKRGQCKAVVIKSGDITYDECKAAAQRDFDGPTS